MNNLVIPPVAGNTNSTLSQALFYAAQGWRVVPVRSSDKKPFDPETNRLMGRWQARASTEPAQLAAWFERRPDLGVGIATGRTSKIVVLDFDKKDGKDGFADRLKLEAVYGKLPDTLTQSTPSGGTQEFFLWPDSADDIPNRVGFGYEIAGHSASALCGIDVRSDGGQVNVFPTARDGRPYRWHTSPADTPMAELPARWAEALSEKPAPKRKPSLFDDPDAEPSVSAKGKAESVLAGCAAIERLRTMPKGVSEWLWKMGGGVIGRCERGREAFHRLSALDHDRYDKADADEALRYMLAKSGPHGCESFAREVPDACAGCLIRGKITGPSELAQQDPNLLGLLRTHVYTTDVGKFYDARKQLVKSKDDFSMSYDHLPIKHPSPDKKDEHGRSLMVPDRRLKQKVFIASRLAAKADKGEYTPGEPRRSYRNQLGQTIANTWLDDGIRAVPGDCSVWDEHVEWLIPNDEGQRDLWLDAMAHSLQRPNVKLRIALLLISYAQQLGKGALIETWSKMIGESNFVKITNAELRSDFQGGMYNKQLAFFEELFVRDGDIYNDTKALITEPKLRVQLKFQDFAPARPPLVIVAASNKAVPIRISEPGDARWHVTLIDRERQGDAYYRRLREEGPNQIAAWKAKLLRRDLSDFDPAAPAPMTTAKKALVSDSRSPFDKALDHALAEHGRQVVVVAELRTAVMRQNIRGSVSDTDLTDGLRQRGWKPRGQHKLGHGDLKGSFWTLGEEWDGSEKRPDVLRAGLRWQGGPGEE